MPSSLTPSAVITEDGRTKSASSSEVLQSYLRSQPSVTDRLAMGGKSQNVATSRENKKALLEDWERKWNNYTPNK
ncbi:hypothetical protein VMCG_09241 [Cytospora schulzeri]|uniref:Uncharacterized protein n=1 Tax=Cytospora schulzeri TaxID=448051 RepID=A0A423VKY0_9PEZI|nr:hypothetical protein VMCG_09241 [Valsa malicola]